MRCACFWFHLSAPTLTLGVSVCSGGDAMSGEKPFHHGMHYSNAGIVLHYLVRLQPFAHSHLHMQRGRFDEVRVAWAHCSPWQRRSCIDMGMWRRM